MRNQAFKASQIKTQENQVLRSQMARSAREARVAKGSKVPLLEERDIDVRELRSKNKTIAKAVAELVQQVSSKHALSDFRGFFCSFFHLRNKHFPLFLPVTLKAFDVHAHAEPARLRKKVVTCEIYNSAQA